MVPRFREFCSVDGRSKGCARWEEFSIRADSPRADIEQEFSERWPIEEAAWFFRQRRCGPVAFLSLDQPQFLEIAGKRSLGNAELLRGKAAAQLFLVGNLLVGNQAKDLTVPECLVRIHFRFGFVPSVFCIQAIAYSCQWFD